MLEHDVEMSVLENTRTYLMNSLLECRALLNPTEEQVMLKKTEEVHHRKHHKQEQEVHNRKWYKQEVEEKYLVVDPGYKERSQIKDNRIGPGMDVEKYDNSNIKPKEKTTTNIHTTNTQTTTTSIPSKIPNKGIYF